MNCCFISTRNNCFFFVSFFCVALLLSACVEDPPVKVGFVGGLTGRASDLAVSGRDGVMLAVEVQNRRGGINGRKIELIIKDDRHDAVMAKQVVNELLADQVVAILGHMTSSMTMATYSITNAAEVVMMSPTSTTDQLSAQDDHFFRVTTPLSNNAEKLAQHVTETLDLKRIAVIYDLNNRSFTETWLKSFRQALQSRGGEVIHAQAFTSQSEVHFLPLAKKTLAEEPEGVLLLSNAIDTALVAQQIRKLGSSVSLFTSEWAFTSDLINFGGRAVHDMVTYQSFNSESREAHYLVFKENFTSRFGYKPSFATVLAYDAVSCLFTALQKTPSRSALKETLLKTGSFDGLQSSFVFDPYGDVERSLFLTTVKDGHFKVMQQL